MQQEIKKVINYIECNINRKIDIETLSNVSGYSRFHLSRLFKLYTGEVLMQYIKRLRLEKNILKLSQKSTITDIELDSGFEGSSSYNKAFSQLQRSIEK